MHRSLQISEVIYGICDQLDQSDHLERNTCIALSLTCKAFLEPALDHIWRDLSSFDPLVACLPADLWRVEIQPMGRSKGVAETEPYYSQLVQKLLHLQREVTPADLDRYLSFYARRIRTFQTDSWMPFTILSVHALKSIQVASNFKKGALAPSLHALKWVSPTLLESVFKSHDAADDFYPIYASLFLSEHVDTLHLCIYKEYTQYMAEVHSALDRFPELKVLSMEAANGRVLNDYVGYAPWYRLEKLSSVNTILDDSIIATLSAIPCLRLLVLQDPYSETPALTPQPSGSPPPITDDLTPPFPSLESLTLIYKDLRSCNLLLRSLPPSNRLHSIHISYTHGYLQNTIDTIHSHVNHLTLRKLIVIDDFYPTRDYFSPSLEKTEDEFWDDVEMQPLLAFKNLVTLRIVRKGWHTLLTPDFVHELEMSDGSWRNLEELDLCGTRPTTQVPLINHDHFLKILEACPALRNVALFFDATRITFHDESPSAPFPLQNLSVRDSPIASPDCVLNFLDFNLPNILSINGIPGCMDPPCVPLYRKRWEEVEETLRDANPRPWILNSIGVDPYLY
ncbi:hypothetical protein DFP72DRAFT_880967 [Ephemerocybe angulata]|uniref:F-box domain-containing protein n=1 Tax=Ephemerocybe angulata TaxID=980116 RepID=A0A8H6MDS3_9AGAR|nr:hypothetical protein DFP72DRAFT_880967 [Tulosesus angulatus]